MSNHHEPEVRVSGGARLKGKIRVQLKDGNWQTYDCEVENQSGHSATLYVPAFDGVWDIHTGGMVGNYGGNDWRIYTLHPDDCLSLCSGRTGAP